LIGETIEIAGNPGYSPVAAQRPSGAKTLFEGVPVKKRLAVLLVVAAGLAISPAGWKWGNSAHAGWSWTAEIASVDGDLVTLENRKGGTLTLQAIASADPVEGEDVTVVDSALVWVADGGGTVTQPLGWSWTD
jgi:hypothetical protein